MRIEYCEDLRLKDGLREVYPGLVGLGHARNRSILPADDFRRWVGVLGEEGIGPVIREAKWSAMNAGEY